MITDAAIEIDAPAEVVWDVFADVERWPEWTTSVTTLTGLDGAALEIGRRYEIKQPKMPKLVWEVTALESGRAWQWQQESPGGLTIATHEVAAIDEHRTLVRQRIEQRGWLGRVFGVLTKSMTKRYMALEAEGLKRFSEQRARAATS